MLRIKQLRSCFNSNKRVIAIHSVVSWFGCTYLISWRYRGKALKTYSTLAVAKGLATFEYKELKSHWQLSFFWTRISNFKPYFPHFLFRFHFVSNNFSLRGVAQTLLPGRDLAFPLEMQKTLVRFASHLFILIIFSFLENQLLHLLMITIIL